MRGPRCWMENRSWLSLLFSTTSRGVVPAPDEIDNLDLVAVADQRRGKRVAPDDDHVVFDGNAPGIDVQPFEQLLHGHRLLEIVRVPVERNPHGRGLAEFYCTESGGWGGRKPGRSGRSERSSRSSFVMAERRTARTVRTTRSI